MSSVKALYTFTHLIFNLIPALALEECYDDLGCLTDDLPCHKEGFPPNTPADVGARYFLFTRRTFTKPYELFRNDIDNIRNSPFDALSKTKIICHGFSGNYTDPVYTKMKDAFLTRVSINDCTIFINFYLLR